MGAIGKADPPAGADRGRGADQVLHRGRHHPRTGLDGYYIFHGPDALAQSFGQDASQLGQRPLGGGCKRRQADLAQRPQP